MNRRRARRLYAKALWYELRCWMHEAAADRLRKRADRRDAKSQHFFDIASRYDDLSQEARHAR